MSEVAHDCSHLPVCHCRQHVHVSVVLQLGSAILHGVELRRNLLAPYRLSSGTQQWSNSGIARRPRTDNSESANPRPTQGCAQLENHGPGPRAQRLSARLELLSSASTRLIYGAKQAQPAWSVVVWLWSAPAHFTVRNCHGPTCAHSAQAGTPQASDMDRERPRCHAPQGEAHRKDRARHSRSTP